jgi:DNA mismatch repair protein MutS
VQRSDELIDLPQTTRRNLELVQTLRGEDAPTLFSLLDTCLTGMGSRLLKSWLLEPAARPHPGHASAWPPSPRCAPALADPARALKGTSDVERITARIALRQVRPRELVALQQSLQKAQQLAQALQGLPDGGWPPSRPICSRRKAAPRCWRAPSWKNPPRWCATAA